MSNSRICGINWGWLAEGNHLFLHRTKTISAAELVYGGEANAPTSFTWKNVFHGTSENKREEPFDAFALQSQIAQLTQENLMLKEEVAKIKIKERKSTREKAQQKRLQRKSGRRRLSVFDDDQSKYDERYTD